MKKYKKIRQILTLFTLLSIFILTSCSSEKHVFNNNNLKNTLATSNDFRPEKIKINYIDIKNPDNLHVVINYNEKELDFSSDKNGNSTLSIKDSKINIKKYIDPCDYKYATIAEGVILESKKLVNTGVKLDELKIVNDIISESTPIIYEYLRDKNKNQLQLLYSLPILKSVITTSIRVNIDKEDCGCLPHPASLVGKAYFTCQEDIFYNKEILVASINDYVKTDITEDDKTDADNLLAYLKSIDKEEIRYDDYYNFYTPKELYMDNLRILENVVLDKNISTTSSSDKNVSTRAWCPFGKGSSHGCCGNYKGCCAVWHVACYIHDVMCIRCTPKDFCMSGCIPDKLELVPPCDYN